MKNAFWLLATVLVVATNLFSQTPSGCGDAGKNVIDSNYPSVFLQFERFGSWKPNLGESGEPAIAKGSEVWLRLRNNSCAKIKFEGWSDGRGTVLIGQTYYVAIEENGKYIPQNYGDARVSTSLLPGSSFLFPVRKEHLRNLRSIFVEFEYGWEGLDVRNPIHRAYFRRSVEELESK